jgi:hypothetical protein
MNASSAEKQGHGFSWSYARELGRLAQPERGEAASTSAP